MSPIDELKHAALEMHSHRWQSITWFRKEAYNIIVQACNGLNGSISSMQPESQQEANAILQEFLKLKREFEQLGIESRELGVLLQRYDHQELRHRVDALLEQIGASFSTPHNTLHQAWKLQHNIKVGKQNEQDTIQKQWSWQDLQQKYNTYQQKITAQNNRTSKIFGKISVMLGGHKKELNEINQANNLLQIALQTLGVKQEDVETTVPHILEQIAQDIAEHKIQHENKAVQLQNIEQEILFAGCPPDAVKLFGNKIYGPMRVAYLLREPKIQTPTTIPPAYIMEKSASLGAVMAVYFHPNHPEKTEWHIFLPNPMAVMKTYIKQTSEIREYLNQQGLLDHLSAASGEERVLTHLETMHRTEPDNAFDKLIQLPINQLHRHSMEEIMYFFRLLQFKDTYGEATSNLATQISSIQEKYPAKHGGVLAMKFSDERVTIINHSPHHYTPGAAELLNWDGTTATWGSQYSPSVRLVLWRPELQ